MSTLLLTEALILGLVAGGLGGNLLAKLMPQYSLGSVGSTIAGIAGGGALGHVVFTLFPILENPANSATNLSFPGAIAHVAIGAIGGALLVFVIGKLKGKAKTA